MYKYLGNDFRCVRVPRHEDRPLAVLVPLDPMTVSRVVVVRDGLIAVSRKQVMDVEFLLVRFLAEKDTEPPRLDRRLDLLLIGYFSRVVGDAVCMSAWSQPINVDVDWLIRVVL